MSVTIVFCYTTNLCSVLTVPCSVILRTLCFVLTVLCSELYYGARSCTVGAVLYYCARSYTTVLGYTTVFGVGILLCSVLCC